MTLLHKTKTLFDRLSRQTQIAVAVLALAAIPATAWAVVAISDPVGWGYQVDNLNRLTQQIDKMNEQIATLKQQRDQLINTGEAIGRKSRILVASANLEDLGQALSSSVRCLIPTRGDLERMLPGVDLKNIDLRSTCDVARVYREYLFPVKGD